MSDNEKRKKLIYLERLIRHPRHMLIADTAKLRQSILDLRTELGLLQ